MAGGKETPRQRMIGILYLVLLGLIALNVPDSLLDSFKNITNSLDQSRVNVTTGLDNTYSAFEATKLKEQPEKAAKLLANAKEASKTAGELNAYIEELKKELVEKGGGINPEINDVNARESLDISSEVMINGKKADVLKQKIEETKAKLVSLLGKDGADVNFSLNANDPPKRPGYPAKTFQTGYFGEGIPLGAVLTTLAKIQADNKNAENEVVKRILGKVDQAQVTLNQFKAVAVAPTSYVLSGQQYKAEIFLTAYDQNSNPTITVGGSSVPTANGVGTYTTTASGEGLRTWTGQLLVKQVDGPPKAYPVTGSYMVAKPSAVVSPDKMNVLYIGVPNPLSVSAPGVAKESMKVSMTGGTITGSAGHYTATVNAIGTAKITVTGDKGMVLGASEFRVKRIPDPKPMFAGKSGGNTSAANLRAQDKLFAKLDNFDFDAKFNVTRFTLIVIKPRQDAVINSASGAELTGAMRSAMAGVTPGSTVVFKEIVAVGPDGAQRGLDAIVLSAN
ncbi:type IX secretion system motor protein PorM/GldM [Mucilaginibacter phyllosphaerae]|uniref:Gliding motility protein GldM n=1 Tax=Mucilaginibacter phyllosphaerae TaxID=1812349 RepID=A0A4Y8AMC3_9SPHI|nr:gliding motility protein GldM [Mucilaginibacter phyllosphaerae]MBB3967451.1 gliding motility-associated protein GldM [Mucilaginibacter phyllosphaerae]TEW69481.1 gliding motility protein GldM [Mucilaginibacter phyllosphaerae]GGH20775.1 gliding motility protein GldM [Mucilaginibacter phyllosphaerae]